MKNLVKTILQLNEDEKSVIKNNVIKEMRKNRYDSNKDTMKLTDAQAFGLEKVRAYYKEVFTKGDGWGLKANLIKEADMPKTIEPMLQMVTKLSKFLISFSGLPGFQALSVKVIKLLIRITGHIMKMQETIFPSQLFGGAVQV